MNFTEEQLQKIRESLLANGIEKDVVEFTIADLKGDVNEDDQPSEGDPTEPTEEGNPDEPKPEDDAPAAPVEEPEGEPAPVEEPPVEEVPPVVEEQVPPEVPPVEEPPVAPEAASAPVGYDDSELRAQLEEQKAANAGLLKRVESLEEALRVSGILVDEKDTEPVGDETPKAPANNPDDDPMDDVLRQINGHKY